ncbi:MAG: FeoB-associated Cys-rich membrane protein [Bacteroidota bacterium]
MDTLLMDWQESISLLIVLISTLLLIRSMLKKRKTNSNCASCALMNSQTKNKSNSQ